MQSNPKADRERKKKCWDGKFLVQRHFYDLTPPAPLKGATIIKPAVNLQNLCGHRFHSSQIATFSPLLVPIDLGLPVDDLVILNGQFTKEQEKLAQEDLDLINEKIMWVKKD